MNEETGNLIAHPFRWLGVIIQGFAIFAALATFEGRLYFISYYQTLRIPLSDVTINLIDYATISPNVTILAIGYATFSIAVFFTGGIRSKAHKGSVWDIVLYAFMFVGGIAIVVLSPFVYDYFSPVSSIMFGFLMVLGFYVNWLSRIFEEPQVSQNVNTRRQQLISTLRKPLIAAFTYSFLTIMIISWFTPLIAQREAEDFIEKAPEAYVYLKSDKITYSCSARGSEFLCDDEISAKLIFFGIDFAYLFPIESDTYSSERIVIAIPTEDIKRIVYTDSRDRD